MTYKVEGNFLKEIKWNGIFKANNKKISQGSRRAAPFFFHLADRKKFHHRYHRLLWKSKSHLVGTKRINLGFGKQILITQMQKKVSSQVSESYEKTNSISKIQKNFHHRYHRLTKKQKKVSSQVSAMIPEGKIQHFANGLVMIFFVLWALQESNKSNLIWAKEIYKVKN